MKKTLIAAVAALSLGSTAFAGSLAPSVMEPEVVYTQAETQASGGSSGSGLIIPLILIALIGVALSSK